MLLKKAKQYDRTVPLSDKRVIVCYVKLIKVNVVQEHIDSAKVICSKIYFLTVKALTNIFLAKNLSRFQKQ